MGGADAIPGVSGGTVALILGIYQRLVTAISHFDTLLLGHLRHRRWRAAAEHLDLRFLLALGCGILSGFVLLASVMNFLLQEYLQETLAVFFGLILASSVLVARGIHRWDAAQGALAVGGAAFAFWLVAQPFMGGREGLDYLFLCGMVAICAMILPGISGAFILLIMGRYEYVTGIVRSLVHGDVAAEEILALAVFATGCLVGLLSFTKVLRWLLARLKPQTMAVLCGFMIGSLRRIWPFKAVPTTGEPIDLRHHQVANAWPSQFDTGVVAAILLAAAAVAFVFALDWITRRHASPE